MLKNTFFSFSALCGLLLVGASPGMMMASADSTIITSTTMASDPTADVDNAFKRRMLRGDNQRDLQSKCDQCNSCACDSNCDCIYNKCDQCNSCVCDANCDCLTEQAPVNKCDQCNFCTCDANCDCINGPLPPPTDTTGPQSFSDFCWKNSYGRGVGTIPSTCPSDRDQRGLLCYSKCPEGFANPPGTVDCHQVCPEGFRDDGLFCRRSEYGRGAGYPWQFGDPAFSAAGQFGRCHNDHGDGNCELNGGLVYPKCADGYHAFGCCICRPDTPDCTSLGFAGQLDLSCTKSIILGDPTWMGCGEGQEYNVGLCYTPCGDGYFGVGPVCWGQPPSGWVDCGFGAARDQEQCEEALKDQIMSVTDTVLFVASLGASSATRPMSKGTQQFYDLVEQANKLKEMVDLVLDLEENRPEALLNNFASWFEQYGNVNFEDLEPEDLFRVVAEMASEFDESGIASIFAAYTWPLCSKIDG
jgi:hypothetical protein